MYATLPTTGMPSSNAIERKSWFLNSSHIPLTVSMSVCRKERPTHLFPLQLVSSYPIGVIDLRNSTQHCVSCSHMDEAFIEEEEMKTKQELQVARGTHQNIGVTVALALLSFYRSEISPFLPQRCRFVPSCSEYSMQAYQRYGVIKGTILTAWRLMRCNPLGPSGFDPPRWFGESKSLID